MNDAAVQGPLEHLRLRLRACPTFFLVIITTFCFKAHSVFPLLLSCCAVCEGMLTRSGRAVDSHSHPSGIPNRQAFSCNDYQMGKDVDQNRNNGNSLSAMDSCPSLPSRFPAQRGLSVRPPVCPPVPPSASQLLVWALTASQKKKATPTLLGPYLSSCLSLLKGNARTELVPQIRTRAHMGLSARLPFRF